MSDNKIAFVTGASRGIGRAACLALLDPGFVMTESIRLNDPEAAISEHFWPAPPSVPAAVIAWLADRGDIEQWNGDTVHAQKLALDHSLHADWRA